MVVSPATSLAAFCLARLGQKQVKIAFSIHEKSVFLIKKFPKKLI
jgi:hypothetical protein